MIWKVLTLVSVALGVLGHEPAISEMHMRRHDEPVQRGHHGELGHIGHELKHHEEYAWSYPSYEYAYKVHDPHTGDNHGHAEVRQGDEVKGEYYLVEPTGNKRVVKYHADKTGFHAEVHNSAPLHHVYYKPVHEHNTIHHEPPHHDLHRPHVPLLNLEPIVVHEPKHLRPAKYEERVIHYPHHRVHYEEPHHHREHHHYGLRRLHRDDKQQREQFEETEQNNQVEQQTENQ